MRTFAQRLAPRERPRQETSEGSLVDVQVQLVKDRVVEVLEAIENSSSEAILTLLIIYATNAPRWVTPIGYHLTCVLCGQRANHTSIESCLAVE